MLPRAIGLAVVVAALLGLLLWSQQRQAPLVVSGFIEADDIRLGSRVGGRVRQVHVHEGARVQAGQVLLELDPYDLQERRAEAQGQLVARRAELQRLEAGFRDEEITQATARRDQIAARLDRLRAGPRQQEIAAAEARLQQASADLTLARRMLRRTEASYENRAASLDELDRAREEVQAAVATEEVRRQELDLLRQGTRAEEIAEAEAHLREAEAALALMKAGYRQEDIAAARAAVASAEATVQAIDRQLAELRIVAPVDGIVEAIQLQPGDLVAPGAPALSLLDTRTLWVRAYVPENRLDVQLDQRVPVTVDSYPGRSFAGRVTFIARQAEFTPGNVQTPEERSKQVFRIKVTLEEGLDLLRPGMAADVHLERSADAPATRPAALPAATQPPTADGTASVEAR